MATVETDNGVIPPKKIRKGEMPSLLYVIGQTGHDIYNAMTLQDDERDKIDILFTKFEAYCKPRRNVTIERYRFNSRAQGKLETVDQYVTELIKLILRTVDMDNWKTNFYITE